MAIDILTLLDYSIAFFTIFVVSVFLLLYLRHRKDYLKAPAPVPSWEPTVSIVIPAYNEEIYISDCLRTVLALDYPHEKLDVIVVDDGSTDSTFSAASKFSCGCLRVFKKQNAGKGAALNFGLARTRGEFIATMDADSYLTTGTLRGLLPHFADPEVMAVTPAVKIRESNSWVKEFQRIEYLMILFSRKLLSFIDAVPVTPGPFSLFRASVFEKVGGFDEKNLVEDQEIALRIQSNNFKIHSSMTADVYTEPPAALKDLIKQRIRWQRGGFRNYWKYKFMIKPEFGDFGMYFVPLNFATITAFFLLLGLMAYSFVSTPYYVRYIWFESFGLSFSLFTFIATFVFLTSTMFLYLAIRSFPKEKIRLGYLASFVIFYWFLSIGYNVLFVWKEIRGEKTSW